MLASGLVRTILNENIIFKVDESMNSTDPGADSDKFTDPLILSSCRSLILKESHFWFYKIHRQFLSLARDFSRILK